MGIYCEDFEENWPRYNDTVLNWWIFVVPIVTYNTHNTDV